MIFDPLIGKPILDQVSKRAEDQLQQMLVDKKHRYWVECPGCGHTVVRKELIGKGCFRCGWQGTEDEIYLAGDEGANQVTQTSTVSEMEKLTLYKIDCPGCEATVVREHLIEKGCYRCGWKPAQ